MVILHFFLVMCKMCVIVYLKQKVIIAFVTDQFTVFNSTAKPKGNSFI